jgi:hypothetical protein
MRAVFVVVVAQLGLAAPAAAQDAGGAEFFESRIRPLLTDHCLKCHGEKKPKGGLRLDSKAGWEKGGDSGPALVPRKAGSSLLVRQIRGEPGSLPQMPPDKPLPAAAVADFVKWIEMGAPDPRSGTVQFAKQIDWKAAGEFWAFLPVRAADPSASIDRFIDARLAQQKLKPVPRADRWTLIRRVSFGLTGLPPSESEIREFLDDSSPEAFAKVIDRLLASSAYGEHQARLWLDLARYAEDQAHVSEGKFGNAWRYRDWVIEAFNKDLPYDRFVKLQIAADLMEQPEDDPADRRALGFLGLGNMYYRPNDLPRARAEQWDDRIDTLTRTFLGLTVSCARCHDHKFDPIPTIDYYSLAGVIAGTKEVILPVSPRDQVAAYDAAAARAAAAADKASAFLQAEADRRALEKTETLAEAALAVWADPSINKPLDAYLRKGGGRPKRLEQWDKLLSAKDGPREPSAEIRELAELFRASVKENLSKPLKQRNQDQYKALFGDKGVFALTEKVVVDAASVEWKADYAPLQAASKAAAAEVPPEPARCHGVTDVEKPVDLKVYVRGNPYKTGEPAPRRFLRILAGADAAPFNRGSGRLDLADAIADPGNPLTARVLVNRIWQQHFGRGLVATPSNFGALGARPTHPELLDQLADRFVRGGRSIKRLHREILLSEAYQRGSGGDPRNETLDPENQGLWRVSRRRLTAEELRDAVLAVSGGLDRRTGGASGDVDDVKDLRRTVYGKVSRMDLGKVLRLFDFPDPNLSSERRIDTTLPQQSLFLLNSPFMIERARALAALTASEPTSAGIVRRAYTLTFGREPTSDEKAIAEDYLSAADATEKNTLTRAERFAHALLASNLFLFID